MVNGLLKKIALGTAIAGSALFGAKEVKAAPVDWNSFTDIVQIPTEFRQTYTSTSTTTSPNNFSGIYFMVTSIGTHLAVGGFDIKNGQITQSYFGNIGEAYTANSALNSNPSNSLEGYWRVFYDSNNDNSLGIWNTDGYFENFDEQRVDSEYDISNFTPFNISNPGTFDFSTTVPEPTTGGLLALGIAALALRRRRPTDKPSSKYHK